MRVSGNDKVGLSVTREVADRLNAMQLFPGLSPFEDKRVPHIDQGIGRLGCGDSHQVNAWLVVGGDGEEGSSKFVFVGLEIGLTCGYRRPRHHDGRIEVTKDLVRTAFAQDAVIT